MLTVQYKIDDKIKNILNRANYLTLDPIINSEVITIEDLIAIIENLICKIDCLEEALDDNTISNNRDID